MTENRLNGLALVNINKKEVISETEIIEDFAKKAPENCNSQIDQNNFIQFLLLFLYLHILV